jgi:diaminohydroxyphosphoribosylaminopyrimidine deaminase/5-amino-6-(5-phosphoribosylamino)uracil reductase
MNTQNSQYMQLAIDEAWKYQLQTYPNPAVGASVVEDGKVLSVEAHKEAGKPHAEVLALKSAYLQYYPNSSLVNLDSSFEIHQYLYENHNDFFHNCEIYVTLEPCNHTGKTPACALLLEKLRIKKVFVGSIDTNKEASGGIERLTKAGIEVDVGLCKEQTEQLLEPFKMWQKSGFVFFKLAMRADGSIDGGYITTQKSLEYVHKIRSKLDLLVIGGNTVRTDRPTLDTRFIKSNNAPDILIYSNQKHFDTTIPLFNVKNRQVTIDNSIKSFQDKNFVMIEGGYKLLEQLKEYIDYLLVFVSHTKKDKNTFDIEKSGFKIINSIEINDSDTLFFLK